MIMYTNLSHHLLTYSNVLIRMMNYVYVCVCVLVISSLVLLIMVCFVLLVFDHGVLICEVLVELRVGAQVAI